MKLQFMFLSPNLPKMKQEIDQLRELLEKAVEKNCNKKTGIVFSSGIDSSIIALLASKFCKVTAYTIGIRDSPDLEYARKAKKFFDFDIKINEIDKKKIEDVLPELLSIVGKPEPMHIAVSIPVYFASKKAHEDGLKIMLSGQGGDELFGGYYRYLEYARGSYHELDKVMRHNLETIYEDNLNRDMKICKRDGIELRFPFMDDEFKGYAMKIPPELKVYEVKDKEDFSCVDFIDNKKFVRKYILRVLAREIGVPNLILNRKKKAVQYGSGTQKILEKIARENGFKKVRIYLESLKSLATS